MSDAIQALLNDEGIEDDCWSDIDESVLAQCEQIENDILGNSTAKHWHEDEVLPTEGHDVGDTALISEVSQKCDKDMSSQHRGDQNSDVDVIKAVKCSELGETTPLQLFSKEDYLCVTDLTQQLWCEQYLCYTLMGVEPPVPTLLHEADLPLPLPTADRPEVKAGKAVHLARELEVHDVVSVSITSSADKWGLHALNLLTSVKAFLVGKTVAREVPIFGDPLGNGDLVFGIIDELRFDPESYTMSLAELKTRTVKRMPGKAQKQQHVLQVLLYKQLWDNLVSGTFCKEAFLFKLGLTDSANRPLGKDLLRHVKRSGVHASTLADLLSILLNSAQALVCISRLEIEYILQDTGSVIGRFGVEEDDDWLRRTYGRYMEYWHGRREVAGVDIEEAWKCGFCEYSPVCEWRIEKSRLLSRRNYEQRVGK